MKYKKHECKYCKYCDIGEEISTCSYNPEPYNQKPRAFLTSSINTQHCIELVAASTENEIINDCSWEDEKRFTLTGALVLAKLSTDGTCAINRWGDRVNANGDIVALGF